MNTGMKILNVIGWILTIVLQVLVGFFGGFIFAVSGYNTWLSTILSLWVGGALGIFAVGAIALQLRRSVVHKNHFIRFSATALGALIPVAILIILSYNVDYDSDLIQNRWGAILAMLAVVTGILGFYAPGWFLKGEES